MSPQAPNPPAVGRFVTSLTNPFAAYAAGFILAVSVYSLGYSDLYPPLQPSLECFLLGTCVICLYLARATSNIDRTSTFAPEPLWAHVMIFCALMGAFAIELAAFGGIPLLLIAADAASYGEFGIPVLHVAFFGTCHFYTVYWFDLFLLRRGSIFLGMSLVALATALLAVSRGGFVITVIAMVVVYLQRRGLSRRLLLIFAMVGSLGLYGFGVLGDIRTHGVTGESLILRIGAASDKFRESPLPPEFFWAYLYTSSPLSNLQLNVTDRVRSDAPGLYFALELLPDFVSKRIVSEADITASVPLLVSEQLNVSTMYGRAFALMGWPGVCISFLYFVLVSLICLKVLRHSRYLVSTIGILSSLAFLAIFDNMFVAAGGILQIIVALLLRLFEPRSPAIADELQVVHEA